MINKIVFLLVTLLFIVLITDAHASRHYERDFIGNDGSGTVTVDVTDKIVFTIHVTSGQEFFCYNPESIVQGGTQYTITTYTPGTNEIKITWQNFDGCGDIYETMTSTGTMSTFPTSFNVRGSFRIYCGGIWDTNDYFDIPADSNVTTSSTTTTIQPVSSRHYERDFIGNDGSGTVTVDVTDKIVFTIHVTSGQEFFCYNPESIVQGGTQYTITTYTPGTNEIKITWQNFDGCGDIYETMTSTGTMSTFPTSFNVRGSFRIYCGGIWDTNDYFDIPADSNVTTSSTTTTITDGVPPVIGAVTAGSCSISVAFTDNVALNLAGSTVKVLDSTGKDITSSLTGQTITGDGTTSGSISFYSFPVGLYTLYLTVKDTSGNITTGVKPANVTTCVLDTVPPVIGAVTTSACSISVAFTDNVALSLAGSTVKVLDSTGKDITSSLTGQTITGDGTTSGSISFYSFPVGLYTLYLTVKDTLAISQQGLNRQM